MEHAPRLFDPYDTKVSELACRAAITIDQHLMGKTEESPINECRAVVRLGKILYMATQPQITQYNPSYIAVRDHDGARSLLADLLLDEEPNKFEELVSRVTSATREVALDIIKMKELSQDRQRELRDFCLELSRKAMSYGSSHYKSSLAA